MSEGQFTEGIRARRFRAASDALAGVGVRLRGESFSPESLHDQEHPRRSHANLIVVSRPARRVHPSIEVVRHEIEDGGFRDIQCDESDSPSPAAAIAIVTPDILGPSECPGIVHRRDGGWTNSSISAPAVFAVYCQDLTKLVVKLDPILISDALATHLAQNEPPRPLPALFLAASSASWVRNSSAFGNGSTRGAGSGRLAGSTGCSPPRVGARAAGHDACGVRRRPGSSGLGRQLVLAAAPATCVFTASSRWAPPVDPPATPRLRWRPPFVRSRRLDIGLERARVIERTRGP